MEERLRSPRGWAIVSASDALSYEALAGDGTDGARLAYWIGLCDVAGLHDITAAGTAVAMSYQHDIEQQADRTGRVLTDVDWGELFIPVAPVQLTQAWSPLAAAALALGEPAWLSVAPGTGVKQAACVWSGRCRARCEDIQGNRKLRSRKASGGTAM
jgi:hypothetical protein